MLLAKVAMDVEAKHNEDNIAKWTYEDVQTKLWSITPLSKMWGIGKRLEERLNALRIYSIGDLANTSQYKLKDKFGIMGVQLWNHANGIDRSRIQDFKNIKKEKSFSHSQVLFKDYFANAKLIIEEMTSVLVKRLREHNYDTSSNGLGITYSKELQGCFYHLMKLDVPTNNEETLLNHFLILFDCYYNDSPIRKISMHCGGLTKHMGVQLNLFENYEENLKKQKNVQSIDTIQNKFGKNSLLKASSLLEDSTIKERNQKIGGHYE